MCLVVCGWLAVQGSKQTKQFTYSTASPRPQFIMNSGVNEQCKNSPAHVHPTHGHLSLQPLTWVSRKPKNAAFSSIEFALALLTFPSSRSQPALADWLLLFTIVSLRSIHGAWSICGGRLACRYRPRGDLGGNGPWNLSSRRCLG